MPRPKTRDMSGRRLGTIHRYPQQRQLERRLEALGGRWNNQEAEHHIRVGRRCELDSPMHALWVQAVQYAETKPGVVADYLDSLPTDNCMLLR